MSKQDKVTYHVVKEIKALGLTNSVEVNTDVIAQKLLKKYKEYESYPNDMFISAIEQAINTVFAVNVKKGSAAAVTMDLNKSLSLSYSKMNSGSSKRHRPEDNDDGTNSDSKPNNADNESKTNSNFRSSLIGKKRARNVSELQGRQDIGSSDNKQSPLGFLSQRPVQRLSHLAGIDSILAQIEELVFYPIQYSHLYAHIGVRPPCGLLLHGPSGCGKTSLAYAIAGELDLPFFRASGPELVGGTTGESEERVREIFAQALEAAPSVLFIDSLDVIAGKKESSQRGMDRRIIAQLFDSIDSILTPANDIVENQQTADKTDDDNENSTINQQSNKTVILIAATNKPDNIDPGVRGRFSREISLPVPDALSRTKILALATSSMRLADNCDLTLLGKLTPGFVGADLHALAREAGMLAVTRIVKASKTLDGPVYDVNISEDVNISMEDLMNAAKSVQPSAKREGFAVVPNVTWSDVGALSEVREELLHNVLEPISHPERFKSLGLEIPAGVLFFGPPGCGKTLLAKAIANQSGANFISVKGPELLNMYVGESESKVRQVFSRARSSTPCVIFFDELDALCPKRGSSSDGNNVSERVVNQLLTELDGLEVRKDVYIIAATNRLELIDDAILRPGRLGKLLYVPLPTALDRVSILKALVSKNICLDENVNVELIAKDNRAEGFTGADLASLVREAGLAVVREWRCIRESKIENESIISEDNTELKAMICDRHFEAAFSKVRPSVSLQDRKRYERVFYNIKQGMGAIQALKEASHYAIKDN